MKIKNRSFHSLRNVFVQGFHIKYKLTDRCNLSIYFESHVKQIAYSLRIFQICYERQVLLK